MAHPGERLRAIWQTNSLPATPRVLKAYFQIETQDHGRRLHDKVASKLQALGASLKGTLSAFLALLDAPIEDPNWLALDPPQRRQQTLDAIKSLLLRQSQEQPLLVVCESLQWIDAERRHSLTAWWKACPAPESSSSSTIAPNISVAGGVI